jgi:hypothetical protein
MSPTAGISTQNPSLFIVVARRTLERPPRALLDREFVEAMNHALGEKSPAEPTTRREPAREARHVDEHADAPAPASHAKPRVDVHA